MRSLTWVAIGVGALFLGNAGAAPDESEEEAPEPSPGLFAEYGDYRPIGPLEAGPATFDGFVRSDWTPSDEASVEGAFLFVLRGEGDPYAYRVDDDVLVDEDGASSHATSLFFLSLETTTVEPEPEEPDAPEDPDDSEEPEDPEAPEEPEETDAGEEGEFPMAPETTTSVRVGPRVYLVNEAATEEGMRALVARAEAAADEWAEVARTASQPREDPDDDAERQRWLTTARSLETLRAKHPDHLGILRDLILAYSRLVPLETGTIRGTTLAWLLPQRLRDWEEAWGVPVPAEEATKRGVEATLAFHTGVYPRVLALAQEDEEDEAVGSLARALEALGYASFEALEDRVVESEGPTYHVTPIRAEGAPSVPRTDFHRVTYLVRPQDVEGPGLVTFLLAEQRLSEERTRWALYSSIAGTKRLVRLYGETEPDLEDVTKQVVGLVQRALVRPEEAR